MPRIVFSSSLQPPASSLNMTFERFWPAYLAEHRHRMNRALHLAGTLIYLSTLAFLLATGRYAWFWTVPVVAYGFAWTGHFAIEKNRPATFGHPVWSLRGDFQMIRTMWQGRDAELSRIAREQLAQLDR